MREFSKKIKGKIGEAKFEKWLIKNKIPYIRFDQSANWNLNLFKKVKRPDYMILVPHIGMFLVDVKTRRMESGNFCMNFEEAEKFQQLQRYFNLQVWYAIAEVSEYNKWHWVSNDVLLEMKLQTKGEKNKKYFLLPRKSTISIDRDESEGRLIEKLLRKDSSRKK